MGVMLKHVPRRRAVTAASIAALQLTQAFHTPTNSLWSSNGLSHKLQTFNHGLECRRDKNLCRSIKNGKEYKGPNMVAG
ncbi:unnamed protein product, partial [Heterosigma akashiwo]